jgi:hypothetical protein
MARKLYKAMQALDSADCTRTRRDSEMKAAEFRKLERAIVTDEKGMAVPKKESGRTPSTPVGCRTFPVQVDCDGPTH